jgi:hypothetical protein
MSTLAPALVNPYQDPTYQTTILRSGTAPIAPEHLDAKSVRRHISDAYRARGLEGVLPYLDPAIVRDIKSRQRRTNSVLAVFDQLSQDDSLYVILALLALLFAVDM